MLSTAVLSNQLAVDGKQSVVCVSTRPCMGQGAVVVIQVVIVFLFFFVMINSHSAL